MVIPLGLLACFTLMLEFFPACLPLCCCCTFHAAMLPATTTTAFHCVFKSNKLPGMRGLTLAASATSCVLALAAQGLACTACSSPPITRRQPYELAGQLPGVHQLCCTTWPASMTTTAAKAAGDQHQTQGGLPYRAGSTGRRGGRPWSGAGRPTAAPQPGGVGAEQAGRAGGAAGSPLPQAAMVL